MKTNRVLVWVGLVVVMMVMVVMVSPVGARPAPFDSHLPTPTPAPPGPGPGPLPEPGDTAMLQAVLKKLISGGLASVIVYWFLAKDIGKALVDMLVKMLNGLRIGVERAEVARYVAIVLSGLLSLGAYAVALGFGFVADPGSAAAWVNLVLWLMGIGFMGSQMLHARLKPRPVTPFE